MRVHFIWAVVVVSVSAMIMGAFVDYSRKHTTEACYEKLEVEPTKLGWKHSSPNWTP